MSSSAYIDLITTFKCSFNKDNYEYTINIYNDEINDVYIQNRRSKETFHYNTSKRSADIIVIRDKSYNFNGNNDRGTLDHHLFLLTELPHFMLI